MQNDSTTRGGTSAETCRSGCSEGGDDPKPQKTPANTPVPPGYQVTQNPSPPATPPPTPVTAQTSLTSQILGANLTAAPDNTSQSLLQKAIDNGIDGSKEALRIA